MASELPNLSKIRYQLVGHGLGPRRDLKGTSAVLIPLIDIGGELNILFEKRALSIAVQPGEICFPGGRREEGETPIETAVRETCEELLIRPEQIEVLGSLDPETAPIGAPLWPFVGLLKDYHGTFSPAETDHIFTVPLSWFAEHPPKCYMTQMVTVPGEDFPYDLIPGGRDYPWTKRRREIYFYRHPQAVIWGVTGGILHQFLELVGINTETK